MKITDEYINEIFKNTCFGKTIDDCVNEKRKLLAKTLNNLMVGYWSGHTAYHIAVDGGFIKDAKKAQKKELTTLGVLFLSQHQARETK